MLQEKNNRFVYVFIFQQYLNLNLGYRKPTFYFYITNAFTIDRKIMFFILYKFIRNKNFYLEILEVNTLYILLLL